MTLILKLNNRYEHEHLIPVGEDYFIPEKPLPKMEIYVPKITKMDYDDEQVQDAIRDLVWLNKHTDRAFLIEAIPYVLKLAGGNKEDAIEQINEYIKQYASGALKPHYSSYWWVITANGFNGKGKHKILEERLNTQKISDAVEALQGGYDKITQKSVAEHTKLSMRTIKSRWSLVKDAVKQYNEALKEYLNSPDPTEIS